MKVGLVFYFFSMVVSSMTVWAQPPASVCVTKAGAVLRTEPSLSAPMSWKAPKYTPLATTGQAKRGFYEVTDIDDQKHWISTRDITSRIRCTAVRVKRARIRQGPGNEFNLSPIGIADRYYTFLDLGGEDGWTQVQDEMGQRGWVNLDVLWKPRTKLRMSFDQ